MFENSESCHSKNQAIICGKIQPSKYIPGQTAEYVFLKYVQGVRCNESKTMKMLL